MLVDSDALSGADYGFFVDYLHITFLIGLLISYNYFRRTHVSVGGSLAVGYLAAGMFFPLNVLVTVGISIICYLVIHYVILKVYLPRPRQIFAIGLGTGMVVSLIWLIVVNKIMGQTFHSLAAVAVVGVIVPGMLSNSFNKQGLSKTLIPLAWMVPVSALGGLAVTWLIKILFHTSFAGGMYEPTHKDVLGLFIIAAVSVISAIFVQEGPLSKYKLRTGGYVTAGWLVASLGNWRYILLLVLVSVVVWSIAEIFTSKTPLFGKDRFIVLVALSLTVTILYEVIVFNITGRPYAGAENIVFCVLPAIIANDLLQNGPRKVLPGMSISVVVCLLVSGIFWLITGSPVQI